MRRTVDEQTWEVLEYALLAADVGPTATDHILAELRAEASSRRVRDPGVLRGMLREAVANLLACEDSSLDRSGQPSVWMFVGVNGSGKTTTVGKLAHCEASAGRKVVLAAADTFRVAATDQLATWAESAGVEMVAGQRGGDPASVVFDAVEHARAKGAELVLADTAGRLHSNHNLMAELAKIRRVAARSSGNLSEVLLVLDAAVGQNALSQANEFGKVAGLTGAVLTKLDGSAKGGVVLGARSAFGIPVKLIGVGERPEDLFPFDAEKFAEALLGEEGN